MCPFVSRFRGCWYLLGGGGYFRTVQDISGDDISGDGGTCGSGTGYAGAWKINDLADLRPSFSPLFLIQGRRVKIITFQPVGVIVVLALVGILAGSCSNTLIPLDNLCENIDCSGHGTCVVNDGRSNGDRVEITHQKDRILVHPDNVIDKKTSICKIDL